MKLGLRGPPRQPPELALLHGNPGHRARSDLIGRTKPETEAPATKPPTCPRFLSKIARREWRRLIKLLAVRGTPATQLDKASLAMLAGSWARFLEAEQVLSTLTPDEIADQNGRLHPALRISTKAAQHLLMLSKAFGLTPASRGAVSLSGPPPPGRRRPAPAGQRPSAGWSQFDAN